MNLRTNDMKGEELLGYGKVKMASNKPDWCALIVCEGGDGEITVLWDEKHDYLDVSKMLYEVEEEQDPMVHIDVTDEGRQEIIGWIMGFNE